MGSPMISRFDLSGAVLIRSRSFGSGLADGAPRSGRLIDVDLGQRMPSHIRARQGRSSDIALDHHSLMTVPERFDPVLRAAALERQQAHDLERISRRAMKRALFQDDILANREFPWLHVPAVAVRHGGVSLSGWGGGSVRSVRRACAARSAAK